MDYQRLLIDHLDLVTQISLAAARRRHMSPAEQDEFVAVVRLRLVEDDHAILRKFQHRSSLWTYLATVIERISLDYCAETWGRWRPSRYAERRGPSAVALERLVTRDGHTIEEAIEIVRTRHRDPRSHAELHRLWNELPARQIKTTVDERAAAELASPDTADATVEELTRQEDIERLKRALEAAFADMPAQDRVVMALRFDQDMPMADIARIVGSSVATVHRRLERNLSNLRVLLTRAGLTPQQVIGVLGHADIDLPPLLRAEVEKFLGLVRLSKRDG